MDLGSHHQEYSSRLTSWKMSLLLEVKLWLESDDSRDLLKSQLLTPLFPGRIAAWRVFWLTCQEEEYEAGEEILC